MKTIIAVSGGVDSMALLNMVAVDKWIENSDYEVKGEYVVAHFDHGVREDSGLDAEMVRGVAESLGLTFELGSFESKLETFGVDVTVRSSLIADGFKIPEKLSEMSEELAREARYKFLNNVRRQHDASAILTAHHFDDRLETALMNVQRGCGPFGITGFGNREFIKRPLFRWLKEDLQKYAESKGLMWREDSTNDSYLYARNRLRKSMDRISSEEKASWLNSLDGLDASQREAQQLTEELSIWVSANRKGDCDCDMCESFQEIDRSKFSQLPGPISRQIMHYRLTSLSAEDITRKKIETLSLAIRTGKAGKIYDICDDLVLKLSAKTAEIDNRDKI